MEGESGESRGGKKVLMVFNARIIRNDVKVEYG